MMADEPEQVAYGRLDPLCSLNLPINALIGYVDAQEGRTENPFATGTKAASDWEGGYALSVKEGTAKLPPHTGLAP